MSDPSAMRDHDPAPTESFQSLLIGLARLAGAIIGVVVVIVGAWLAVHLFYAVFEALRDPSRGAKTFHAWAEAIGGRELRVEGENGVDVPLAPILATVIIGGGLMILVTLATSMMAAGAKVIAWTAGEQEAVRRVLHHALGPRKQR